MKSNLRVFVHHNEDNLHLKLNGENNYTSALEVIKILDGTCNQPRPIFIQTIRFGSAPHIGSDILEEKCFRYKDLVFTGGSFNELAI